MTPHERHGVLNQCQLDFCSRIIFWIYSVRHVTLACHSKSQKSSWSSVRCGSMENTITNMLLLSLLMCYQYAWCHDMKTFFVLLALSDGNPPVIRFSSQPEMRSLNISLLLAWVRCWTWPKSRGAGDLPVMWGYCNGLGSDFTVIPATTKTSHRLKNTIRSLVIVKYSHTVDNAIRYGVQCLRGCLILITI